jgi:hypothetical protein
MILTRFVEKKAIGSFGKRERQEWRNFQKKDYKWNWRILWKKFIDKNGEYFQQELLTKLKRRFGIQHTFSISLTVLRWQNKENFGLALSSLVPEHRCVLLVIASSAWRWLKQSTKNQHLCMKNLDIKKEASMSNQFLCFPIVTCTQTNTNFLISSLNSMGKRIPFCLQY